MKKVHITASQIQPEKNWPIRINAKLYEVSRDERTDERDGQVLGYVGLGVLVYGLNSVSDDSASLPPSDLLFGIPARVVSLVLLLSLVHNLSGHESAAPDHVGRVRPGTSGISVLALFLLLAAGGVVRSQRVVILNKQK